MDATPPRTRSARRVRSGSDRAGQADAGAGTRTRTPVRAEEFKSLSDRTWPGRARPATRPDPPGQAGLGTGGAALPRPAGVGREGVGAPDQRHPSGTRGGQAPASRQTSGSSAVSSAAGGSSRLILSCPVSAPAGATSKPVRVSRVNSAANSLDRLAPSSALRGVRVRVPAPASAWSRRSELPRRLRGERLRAARRASFRRTPLGGKPPDPRGREPDRRRLQHGREQLPRLARRAQRREHALREEQLHIALVPEGEREEIRQTLTGMPVMTRLSPSTAPPALGQ